MHIIFDIDGTICFDGVTIKEDIVRSINKLSCKYDVIFASARPIRDSIFVLAKYFESPNIIGANGAMMKVDGKFEYEFIDQLIVKKYYQIAKELDLDILIDYQWDYFYNGKSCDLIKKIDTENGCNICEISFENVVKIVLIGDKITKILQDDQVSIKKYLNEKMFEITNKGVDKFSAINKLTNSYVGFGNDINDIMMLENANVGYVVGELKIKGVKNIDKRDLVDVIDSL